MECGCNSCLFPGERTRPEIDAIATEPMIPGDMADRTAPPSTVAYPSHQDSTPVKYFLAVSPRGPAVLAGRRGRTRTAARRVRPQGPHPVPGRFDHRHGAGPRHRPEPRPRAQLRLPSSPPSTARPSPNSRSISSTAASGAAPSSTWKSAGKRTPRFEARPAEHPHRRERQQGGAGRAVRKGLRQADRRRQGREPEPEGGVWASRSGCRSAPARRSWEAWNDGLTKRREVVAKLAKAHGAALVKYQRAFDEAAKRAPADYWIWDGVHPTYRGHQVMADEWLRTVREFWPLPKK